MLVILREAKDLFWLVFNRQQMLHFCLSIDRCRFSLDC